MLRASILPIMGLVASLCLTPVHAYYSNYSLAFREEHGLLGMRGISQRDCSAFGTDEGSFCGDIDTILTNTFAHSVPVPTPVTRTALLESAPPPLLMRRFTARRQTPAPQVKTAAGTAPPRMPWSAADIRLCAQNNVGVPRIRTIHGRCAHGQSLVADCKGKYVCVDAEYDSLVMGSQDYANCDGADVGQALICEYSATNNTAGNDFCQQNDAVFNTGCGDVRAKSTLSGVCNGMTYDGITDYCTWKPGPCEDDTDCDNGLLCSPVNKMCGGPGASCTDNNGCGDPYPCQDNGAGASFCADYNAGNGRGTAQDGANDSGLWTICDSSDPNDTTCSGGTACGSGQGSQPGVCGGAGAACQKNADCATGTCQTGNTCAPWQTAYMSVGQACTYSNQCQSGLECMDNGLGEASCGYSSSKNARVCQPGWVGACGTDPTYSSCGYPRGSSSETGVCGGSGASCSDDTDCWTGTCSNGQCAFGPLPTTVLNTRKRAVSGSMCPKGQSICPVGYTGDSNQFVMTGHECINLETTIDSCGGCTSIASSSGRDCTDIDYADVVGCFAGKCLVESCLEGWMPTANGTLCEPESQWDSGVGLNDEDEEEEIELGFDFI
ncbi:hypothetical protein EHS25_007404 [Saitozyma podzolica]|uniref:Protein CPL1-like domain-containing protein n=1 Tax=Saitozyma podzolica TaxID=1890683 RepID=A0A427YPP4_9TREE|nr:hypothetical protein EHS25_007404 [Saitozyma podzolica]